MRDLADNYGSGDCSRVSTRIVIVLEKQSHVDVFDVLLLASAFVYYPTTRGTNLSLARLAFPS